MGFKDLFKKKSGNNKTVSEENAEMLPDEKRSKSDITTERTNKILVFIAFTMLAVFIIGALINANKNTEEIKSIEKNAEISNDEKKLDDIPYISPIVSMEPEKIEILNQIVGEEAFNQIIVTVLNNPIKIVSAELSFSSSGANLESGDCTIRETLPASSSCILNLSFSPEKPEKLNGFIIVKYNELNDGVVKNADRTAKIPVSLNSVEKQQEVFEDNFYDEEPSQEDDFFEDDFIDEEPFYDDEFVDEEPFYDDEFIDEESRGPSGITPDDCKKYASKAYDFSGTFIGWVQGNNDVFSPNCSSVIGVMEDDGMVIQVGTGKVLGKGTILDKKKAEEKRLELTVPLLDDIIESENASFEPDFEEVMENRMAVKFDQVLGEPRKEIGGEDIYRLSDTLGIYDDEQRKLIPFTITGTDQVSSMPKDERYVLRQSKPIPAVLNRAIYFSGNPEKNGAEVFEAASNNGQILNASATVEKNVYGGDGRTIIIPAGSQLLGVAEQPMGTFQAVEKINVTWNRLIRPDGAEFDLSAVGNYSADAQGRAGVPGKNDTGYMQDLFVKPLLYSALPVALEALFPTTSALVTRVKRTDGTYQTIDQFDETGEFGGAIVSQDGEYGYDFNDLETMLDMTSEDKMKAEIEQNFKTVMEKIIDESSKQNVPFTVPSGTRIQVFLNKDIMLRINDQMEDVLNDANYEYQYQN